MTYPPGTPGFQPSPPSGSYGPPASSYVQAGGDAESRLPLYLKFGVVGLGLSVYLANFAPIVNLADVDYPLVLRDGGHTVPLAALAALLAGVSLLPKAKSYTAVVAVIATLGGLLAISTVGHAGGGIGWGMWLIVLFSILQAGAAIGSLLVESGVVTPPPPRPKYDPYAQYGLPPGGNYYGQQGQQGQQNPQAQQGYGHPGQQASAPSGYPSYGSYPSGPSGPSGASGSGFGNQQAPSSGAFNSGAQPAPQGPPTPPTGFPTYSPPAAGGSANPPTGGQNTSGPNQGSTGGQQSQGGAAPSGPSRS
ncbi:DUF5336 domain-containing protein [Mycolicibacter minnesotensis]